MKKTLVGVSLLAVFLIMMLPTVAAEEAKVAQSTTISPYILNIQTTYIEAIREKSKDNPNPQFILLTLAILLLKLLRWGEIFIVIVILKILGRNNTTGVTF